MPNGAIVATPTQASLTPGAPPLIGPKKKPYRFFQKDASHFVKGRVGEEIASQCFTYLDYEVLPLGIEHTNFKPLYQFIPNDALFNSARRLPDFVAIKNKTFRYIEIKFRSSIYLKANEPHYFSTILNCYYDKIYRIGERYKYELGTGLHSNTLIIWIFKDGPLISVFKNIENILTPIVSTNQNGFTKNEFLTRMDDVSFPWEKPTRNWTDPPTESCFTKPEIYINHTIPCNDWWQFGKNVKGIMDIFNNDLN